jgi:hypothetical protein
MTAETRSLWRGNGRRAMVYMQLHENPEAEAGKGVAHQGRRFHGGVCVDGEWAPVRGQRSGRGGWRSGWRGAPW